MASKELLGGRTFRVLPLSLRSFGQKRGGEAVLFFFFFFLVAQKRHVSMVRKVKRCRFPPLQSSKLRGADLADALGDCLAFGHVDGREEPAFWTYSPPPPRWDFSWEPPTVGGLFSPESACVLCCYFLASIFDFLLTIRVWIPPRQAKGLLEAYLEGFR